MSPKGYLHMHCGSDCCPNLFTRGHAAVSRSKSLAAKLTLGVLAVVMLVSAPAWASNTTTALVVKSAGSTVTAVPAGSVVTLTASVVSAGSPVTTGQVAFCDATAAHCTDIHRLGLSQLTLAGTASLSFVPAAGTHSYSAVFLSSGGHAGSVSSASSVAVEGAAVYPTVTSFSSIGGLGNNLFTATVAGAGGLLAAPTGMISFLDTSNSNAVLATAALGPSLGGVTFLNPSTSAVGLIPYGIVTADFNGDGIPDFATCNYDGDTVTVQLGNGDGTFTAVGVSPPTGTYPAQIIAADFNGDGRVDLAVANYTNASITVLLGNGDGTFTAPARPVTGNGPLGLSVADFNEDGNQDLAATNYLDGTVTILLGNGDGTFTVGSTPSTGSDPFGTAVSDFNQDGHLDLAVIDSGSSQVEILLGNGDGTFTAGATLAVGSYPSFLAVADLNGDGNADLAVVNTGDSTVTILEGDGTGNFTANPTLVATGGNPSEVVVSDFNLDGIADLAVGNDISPGTVNVLLGKGDGTFSNFLESTTANYFYGLAGADFNGDGVPDLAAIDSLQSKVAVLTATLTETATAIAGSVTPVGIGLHLVEASYVGSNTTGPSVSSVVSIRGVPATTTTLVVSSAGKAVASVGAGSVVTLSASVSGLAPQPGVQAKAVDQNAHPLSPVPSGNLGQVNFCDATASDCLGIHLLGVAQVTPAGSASMSYVPGVGSHSYKAVFLVDDYGAASASSVQSLTVMGGYPTTATIAASGSAGNYTLTATITGESNLPVPVDGTISFLDASNGSALLGTAALTGATSNLLFHAASTAATGEYPEQVVTADFNGDGLADTLVVNVEDETLTVLLGRGDGTFTSAPVVYLAGEGGAVVGDFNGDGKPDVALTTSNNTATVLLGNGDGTFTAAAAVPTGADPAGIATGDFNGDGNADLAVTNYDDNTVSILLGNGEGGFSAAPVSPATGAYPYGLVVADLNGDHRADIAVVNESGNTISVLLGNGDGSFAGATTIAVGSSPYLDVAGDFNGDGKIDLAVSNFTDNTLTILLGNGDGTFATTSTPATGQGPFALAIADFNRDGKTDLAVANYTDATMTFLLGNGDGTFTASTGLPATGTGPYAIAIADLNGDGLPDLLVPNYATDTMSVLLTQLQQGAQATLTHVAPLGTGTHNVLAIFPVTASYDASVSSTVPLTAAIGTSALALSANPGSGSSFGDQVVLTATLSPFAPEGVSTNGETITFYNGKTSLGTGTLASGVATLTVSTLPIASNSITASYAGDANLGGSTSSAIAFAVSNNLLTVTLTGGTAATTIATNGTATYAFMVTPGSSSTFGENVTFAVTGGPSGMTATFNPVNLAAGSGPATVTLTLTGGSQAAVKQRLVALTRGLGPMALGMLLLPFAAGQMRRSSKPWCKSIICWGCVALLLSLSGALFGLAGCGGSNTPGASTPAAQNYTLTVTASSGSVSKSTTLALTVD